MNAEVNQIVEVADKVTQATNGDMPWGEIGVVGFVLVVIVGVMVMFANN